MIDGIDPDGLAASFTRLPPKASLATSFTAWSGEMTLGQGVLTSFLTVA